MNNLQYFTTKFNETEAQIKAYDAEILALKTQVQVWMDSQQVEGFAFKYRNRTWELHSNGDVGEVATAVDKNPVREVISELEVLKWLLRSRDEQNN